MMNAKQTMLPMVAMLTMLVGCTDNDGSDRSNKVSFSGDIQAIVNTVAPDYSGADMQLVAIDEGEINVSSGLAEIDKSDFVAVAYKESFYRIGRYAIDTIEKYDFDNASSAVYNYSALDDLSDSTSNPYSLVFASETKAYLMRYNSDKIWIVNPSADFEEDFKIGEIDISHYADSDGVPEASGGVIIDGKIYVLMERLVYFDPTSGAGYKPYVAVFDVETDTEVDTDLGDAPESLKGIELEGYNPGKITYHEDVGIFIVARSEYYDASSNGYGVQESEGGLIHVDPDNYSQTLVFGDDEDIGAYVTNVTILGKNNAFLVAYNGWQDSDLVHFNPSTGELTGDVEGFASVDISALETSPIGNAWVGVSDAVDPRIHILTGDEIELAEVKMVQNPTTISFKSE